MNNNKILLHYLLYDTIKLSPDTIANKIQMFSKPISDKKNFLHTNLREPHLLTSGELFEIHTIKFVALPETELPFIPDDVAMRGHWQLQLFEYIHTDASLFAYQHNFLMSPLPIIQRDIPFSVNLLFSNLPIDFKPFELRCQLMGILAKEEKNKS